MVITEKVYNDNTVLYYSYSDKGYKIKRESDGKVFNSAYDIEKTSYTETAEKAAKKDDEVYSYEAVKTDIITLKAKIEKIIEAIDANAVGIAGIIDAMYGDTQANDSKED